ncbi:MAG: response regulator [Candidatus Latescibacterota bacterium]|nr:response regulator [Candidatus Latescibacterota bacterium]
MKDLADMRRQLHDLEAQPQIDTGPDPFEQTLQSIVDAVPDIIYRVDSESRNITDRRQAETSLEETRREAARRLGEHALQIRTVYRQLQQQIQERERHEAAGRVRYNTFVGDRGEWSLSDDEEQNARVVAFMKTGVPTYRPDLPFDTGTFAINSRQADAFSESDLNLLQKVAAVLQEGFQRIRDLRTLQERSREAGQRASRRLDIRSGRRWRPSGSIEGKAGDGDPGPVPTTDDQRTLLIIEDEDVVRETTRRLLERQGFHVLAADSGPAGLKIVAEGDACIDLVLLDLSMPTMSGHEVLAELRRLQPDIKVVIVTGYATAEVNVEGAAAILQKPFNVAAHLDRIDQVLSS